MILDVGCGGRLFGDVGFDVGPLVLATDSGKYTKATVYGDVQEGLPWKDDMFEVVHFLGLLHHLKDPVSAWKEMVRVSKDLIVGEEPSVFNPQAYNDPYHVFKGFTKRQLVRICDRDVKHLRVCYYVPNIRRLSINFQILGFKRHSGK